MKIIELLQCISQMLNPLSVNKLQLYELYKNKKFN